MRFELDKPAEMRYGEKGYGKYVADLWLYFLLTADLNGWEDHGTYWIINGVAHAKRKHK